MSQNVKFEYYPKILIENLEESLKKIKKNKEKWAPPFFTDTKSYLDINKIKEVSVPFMHEKIENIIVLGTGGSIQTLLALKHLSHKKIFPLTSSRAVELKDCLDKTTPKNSIVIPISRGGETLDINSSLGIFIKNGYNLIGLSSKGTMFEILEKIDCPILDVPDLSGRFVGSISNVAIVPAYLARLNINNFLNGMNEGYKSYMNNQINPAIELATFLFKLYNKGYKVIFSMPYSKNIEGSVGLFVQEISESTGKEEKGLLGACQSAPLCQHSILEFLLGGSKGCVIPILWTIENEIPNLLINSSINYINNKNAQSIVNFQADATFQALLEQSVPSVKISIKNPDEFNMGYLISFIQSSVYYLSILLDVDWTSNPKVVIGKEICNEALKNNLSTEERKRIREKITEKSFQNFSF